MIQNISIRMRMDVIDKDYMIRGTIKKKLIRRVRQPEDKYN